jgi:hypothetical protein
MEIPEETIIVSDVMWVEFDSTSTTGNQLCKKKS